MAKEEVSGLHLSAPFLPQNIGDFGKTSKKTQLEQSEKTRSTLRRKDSPIGSYH